MNHEGEHGIDQVKGLLDFGTKLTTGGIQRRVPLRKGIRISDRVSPEQLKAFVADPVVDRIFVRVDTHEDRRQNRSAQTFNERLLAFRKNEVQALLQWF